METAIAYARTSTKNKNEAPSIQAQLNVIRRFAETRGIKIIKEFVDEGVSGSIAPEQRPGFSKLLEYIEKKRNKPKAVIVYKYDRLSRGGVTLAPLLANLIKKGVKIYSVDEPTLSIETIDDFLKNQTILQFYDIIAQMERSKTLERMMTVLLNKNIIYRPPYGYKATEKGVEIDPEQAKIVKLLYKAYLLRGMTLNKLSKITTIPISKIKYILENETYKGILKASFKYTIGNEQVKKPVAIKAPELAIIDKETWEKVQRKKKRKNKPKNTSIIHLRRKVEEIAKQIGIEDVEKHYKKTIKNKKKN